MKTLLDSCEPVSEASRKLLLPVIAVWTIELGNLHSHMLSPLLDTAKSLLEVSLKDRVSTNSQAVFTNFAPSQF